MVMSRPDFRDDAREYLRSRPIFRELDLRCFDAFIEHCLVPINSDSCQSHMKLAFPPSVEAAIFRTTPLDVHRDPARRMGLYELAGPHAPPGWLLYSSRHELTSRLDVAAAQRALPNLQCASFPQVSTERGRGSLLQQRHCLHVRVCMCVRACACVHVRL
jgi:hypothetical protein